MNHYLIIFFLVVSGFTSGIVQNNHKDRLTVALTIPEKPGTLEIELVYGHIHVKGYTGKEIIIDAASTGELLSRTNESNSKGMKRIDGGNPLGLLAEEENNHIKVSTNSAFMPVNLTIRVPQRMSLKLRTYDKGDIMVENVIGNMEVDNTTGSITLTNIGGSVVANTYNGRLQASFQPGRLTKPMAFSSMGGQIDIACPASLKANVKVKSERGEVFSDFDIAKSQTKTVYSDDSGRKRTTLDDWLHGRINGGGPEIMIKNYYGNIYLKKSPK
ncbi:DUF4097 family beta strand repeat-containing protein [Runella sp.]|uniref:DUF4097 family beta strand repeat-containing protein n=1 Tax=Runella sp. TaxID=1960881 RepID=UPI003D0F93FE